ncbi:MAG: homoserine kinase [Parachlamydia sp.]|nr:homoserine kinase [Parachlamydia sp.]
MKEIRVFAPATVANVACGFDIFGFALERPGDLVVARLVEKPGVTLTRIEGAALPYDPEKNTAGVSVIRLLKHLGSKSGVELELHKQMPLGSGLGSSAASAAGSLFAVNALLGNPFSPIELIPFAMEAERMACGAAHADNVAPALLGGFVLIRSYQPLDMISIPIKAELHCTILHPRVEIKTEEARKILKKEISLEQLVAQTGNASGLIAGLMQGDLPLISRSLQDVVVEPIRATLIPGYYEMKEAAMKAGALGCSISGSGPSLFALSAHPEQAHDVGQAMQAACQKNDLECDLYLSPINQKGPVIL